MPKDCKMPEHYEMPVTSSKKANPAPVSSASGHEVALTLLDLPAELRNNIYAKVIADMPSRPSIGQAAGQVTLRQPALARVNRQLRSEILPMWYSERIFGICIYPKRYSGADQVWQGFLDLFEAHTTRADGIHHLSGIQRLQVELWHPACHPHYFGLGLRPRRGRKPLAIPLSVCNGVYLHFGFAARRGCHRVADHDIDWTDRDAVQTRLKDSIMKDRADYSWYRHGLQRFWKTFPLDRLVDMAMMVAVECKEAARSCHITTSFAP